MTEHLKKLELHRDKCTGEYYLSALYEIDRCDGIYELDIPKIILPIYKNRISFTSSYDNEHLIDIGFGNTPIRIGQNGYRYSESLIRSKTKKMTLAEIEKKLGHKIELVSE